MKQPKYAKLLIREGICFPVIKIHFETKQVTLQEKEKVFNTVSIKNVDFDFSDFTVQEKEEFCRNFL